MGTGRWAQTSRQGRRRVSAVEPRQLGRGMPAADQLQEPLLKVLAGRHLLYRARRADLSGVDDGDVRAHLLHQRHHVRGDDDRAAGGRVLGEDVLEVRAGHRVDRLERLIKHQDARAVNHRGRQADLLGHARGIIGHHRVRGGNQIEGVQQVAGATVRHIALHAAQHARIDQQLHSGEPVEYLVGLRHDADLTFGGVDVLPHVLPEDHRGTGVGNQQAGHHVERGRLARAVRADEAEKRADRDVEGQSVDRNLAVEALVQAANGDRRARVGRRQCRNRGTGGDG